MRFSFYRIWTKNIQVFVIRIRIKFYYISRIILTGCRSTIVINLSCNRIYTHDSIFVLYRYFVEVTVSFIQ